MDVKLLELSTERLIYVRNWLQSEKNISVQPRWFDAGKAVELINEELFERSIGRKHGPPITREEALKAYITKLPAELLRAYVIDLVTDAPDNEIEKLVVAFKAQNEVRRGSNGQG